ncbi:MAG TPA: hypothetical protein VGQ87_01485, partial [Patescibacteria group bacterium]|nr:hypothetical protein [Patescibacteria group bacterium]
MIANRKKSKSNIRKPVLWGLAVLGLYWLTPILKEFFGELYKTSLIVVLIAFFCVYLLLRVLKKDYSIFEAMVNAILATLFLTITFGVFIVYAVTQI